MGKRNENAEIRAAIGDVSARLKALREKTGLPLSSVAISAGLTQSCLCKLERNASDAKSPSADTAIALAYYYGVSLDWLLTGEEFAERKQRERNGGQNDVI